MFFLLPLIGAAVGVTVGALVSHSSSEKDKQTQKYHKRVADDLTTKYSNLEMRYSEYVDKGKNQINDLTRQHALDEQEKDLLRLAIRLQQSLYMLMYDIDNKPTHSALVNFEEAVKATNKVLSKLEEESVQIPERYFIRNLKRAKRREKIAESKKKKEENNYK